MLVHPGCSAGPARAWELQICVHPTTLLYGTILGSIVIARSALMVSPFLLDKQRPILAFGLASATPLLATELLYRAIFYAFPDMVGSRNPSIATWLGFGYFFDCYTHFLDAAVNKGIREADFFLQALRLFRSDSLGWIFAVAITISSGWLGFRALKARSLPFVVLLLTAYTPILMIGYNPSVGQLSRALHATLPLLLIILALSVGDAIRWLGDRYRAYALTAVLPAVIATLAATDGIVSFLSQRQQEKADPSYLVSHIMIPQVVLGDLKAAGIDKIYLYDEGLGMHWHYYLKKYFNALPYYVEHPNVQPTPDVRLIANPVEFTDRVKSGAARVVIFWRPGFLPEIYRRKEDEFLELAPKLGGRRLTGFGRIPAFPPFDNCIRVRRRRAVMRFRAVGRNGFLRLACATRGRFSHRVILVHTTPPSLTSTS